MKPTVRIGKIKPHWLKGERSRDYLVRVKYLQVHAELTALKASVQLEGGNTEARLRGEVSQ